LLIVGIFVKFMSDLGIAFFE